MIKNWIKASLIVATITLPFSSLAAEGSQSVVKKTKEEVLIITENDFVVGDRNAKVKIFEYSSLACPHCATFHEKVFPEIKKNYIDTNKVAYVFRDFPTTHPATLASMLIHCAGERKLNFMDTLFQSQRVWAFNVSYRDKLLGIAKLGGFTDEEFTTCIRNNDKMNEMLANAYTAVDALKIDATPVFFINDYRLEGVTSFNKFSDIVEVELNKK